MCALFKGKRLFYTFRLHIQFVVLRYETLYIVWHGVHTCCVGNIKSRYKPETNKLTVHILFQKSFSRHLFEFCGGVAKRV